MRKQFVPSPSRREAQSICPWAAKIVKVERGFMCFESIDDYRTWRLQK